MKALIKMWRAIANPLTFESVLKRMVLNLMV